MPLLSFFESIGANCLFRLDQLGRMGILLFSSLWSILTPPYKSRPAIKQTYVIGTLSIFVIIFTRAFTCPSCGR